MLRRVLLVIGTLAITAAFLRAAQAHPSFALCRHAFTLSRAPLGLIERSDHPGAVPRLRRSQFSLFDKPVNDAENVTRRFSRSEVFSVIVADAVQAYLAGHMVGDIVIVVKLVAPGCN